MKKVLIAVLMLALAGAAFAQEGVSCLSLTHLHETVCRVGDSTGTIYSMGVIDDSEVSLHTITRDQYLAELKAEDDVSDTIKADLEKLGKQFEHEQVCTSYKIDLMSKKARKKYLAENHCEGSIR